MSRTPIMNLFRAARRKAIPRAHLAVEALESRELLSTYDVGPGLAYTSINSVPWEKLGPGDTVQIHWQPAAYHEKILISTSGTADQPIRVLGIAGPDGALPVIDGQNATTRPQASYPYAGTQDRGLITVTRDSQHAYGFKPSYIQIDGLDLRDADQPYTFTDAAGATRSYTANAASIFVERGEHIVIRDCTITGSGNGLFVASGDDEASLSRDILIEGDNIYGNGNVGSDRQHNVYTEAAGCVFQYNHFGDLRPGALGGALKDRSAGTVIRYNWIQGGARLLDLVDPEDSPDLMVQQPSFHDTYVYGNVLVDGPGGAGTLIHYGGDSGVTSDYRKGTLHFYSNTVIVEMDQSQNYNTTLVEPSTNDEGVDLYNNILYTQAATTGATPTQFNLVKSFGAVTVGANWISPGWQVSGAYGGFQGAITGTNNLISDGGANDPGFVNLAGNDFHLSASSPALDKGQALDATAAAAGALVNRQYLAPQSSEARPVQGAASDLGAFERVSAAPATGPLVYVDAHNTTGHADGSALRPYTSVQAAVAAAAPGSTIEVAQGTYLENVTIPDEDLTLLGGFAGGTSTGYLHGQPGDFSTRDATLNVTRITAAAATAPVIYVNNVAARTVDVDGFTLSGGSHGVYVVADYLLFANVTIAHNIIENNGPAAVQPGGGTYDFFGGGIYSSNATITVTDNIIRDNNANRGGGMYIASKSDYTITGNLVDSNTGWDDHGGGVVLNPLPASATGSGTFAHNTVSNNVASKPYTYGWGGGILIGGNLDPASLKPVNLTDNVITGNSAPSVGGAVFADNGATALLDHDLIAHNSTQTLGGGAVYVDGDGSGVGSFVTMINCTVADNTCAGQNLGNGVYVEEYSRLVVQDCIFWGNTQDLYNVPDGTGSTIAVTWTDTQQGWSGTGNLSKDPLFANPSAGDYHEKSTAGRWDPATSAWVTDAVSSPIIDAGDPSSSCALEPAPNGGRINLGAYGDTAEASKSPPSLVPPAGIVGTSLVLTPAAGGASMTIRLKAGNPTSTEVLFGSTVAVTFSNAAFKSIVVQPSAGNEQLTLDDANGNPVPAGGLQFNGGRGNNTLVGPGASSVWNVTGANAGTLNSSVHFSNVGRLVGGKGNDSFTFAAGGSISAGIDGGGGTNTLDYSSYNARVVVDLTHGVATAVGNYAYHVIANIQAALGGSTATNLLVGTSSNTVWNISGANSGTAAPTGGAAFTFSRFPCLAGGAGNDTFNFTGASASVAGYIDGLGGANTLDYSAYPGRIVVDLRKHAATAVNGLNWSGLFNFQHVVGNTTATNLLVGPDGADTWNITAANAGTLAGSDSFSNFPNLVGGAGDDTYRFAVGASLSGNLGDIGGHNWLDYSAWTSAVRVNLAAGSVSGVAGSVSGVQNVIGGSGNNALTGGASGGILIGGAGTDTITAGAGRSILIGDAGADQLMAGASGDILIGGSTKYDAPANRAALVAVLTEWQRTDVNYRGRVTDIKNGTGLTGGNKLAWSTSVLDDGASNALTGNAAAAGNELDWFFANQAGGHDTVLNLVTGEEIN